MKRQLQTRAHKASFSELVLLIGGAGPNGAAATVAFDPVSEAVFSYDLELNGPRLMHAVGSSGDKIVVATGQDVFTSEFFTSTEIKDQSTDGFVMATDIPTARGGAATALLSEPAQRFGNPCVLRHAQSVHTRIR